MHWDFGVVHFGKGAHGQFVVLDEAACFAFGIKRVAAQGFESRTCCTDGAIKNFPE